MRARRNRTVEQYFNGLPVTCVSCAVERGSHLSVMTLFVYDVYDYFVMFPFLFLTCLHVRSGLSVSYDDEINALLINTLSVCKNMVGTFIH
jgi:hypothetical protein